MVSAIFSTVSVHQSNSTSAIERPIATNVSVARYADQPRPVARGKFIFVRNEKLYVRGVTYGAFRPDGDGHEYWDLGMIERDFEQMAASGVNAVRIPHTTPPRTLLDAALRHGLYVMVGLSAEQYVGYLIDRKRGPDIEQMTRDRVRSIAGHPALLCYAIGNEIPANTVRWLGRRRVEKYLHRIWRAVKTQDPESIVTYVNYPTTEYLDLAFLDLICFNVYLEHQETFNAYLPRLQNIAGNRPLIMSEIGLDGLRNGESAQATVLDWQIRTAFSCGCAGVFIFSWTDEWHRAGAQVEDWEFGVTRRDRSPKPALSALAEAFAELPLSSNSPWPRVSVVVCSHNGSRTIRDCMGALSRLRYPDFERIVVDDGSTDDTAAIAREYGVKVIRTDHCGLSHARNVGWKAANGEIVVYIDDDAYPDPHWLTYLAFTFRNSGYVAVGGPNVPPPGDGIVADCVANSPGVPIHVLLSDCEAEHIPGCNMAVFRSALEAIGGFDVLFHTAGDDVDLCWRLQERGWKLGFNPAAQVWHHCRNSVKAYWRQQKGYGKAEALLARKWPEKYNVAGHPTWRGRVYGQGLTRIFGIPTRVYHGQWGTAPFQSLYQVGPCGWLSMSVMPEWYLVNLALISIGILGLLWKPLLFVLPILAVSAGMPAVNAFATAWRSRFHDGRSDIRRKMLTAFLHMLQPAARLHGRLAARLTLGSKRVPAGFVWPVPRKLAIWTENWQAPQDWLERLEAGLRRRGRPIRRGGIYDRWDLEIQRGLLGGARLLMSAEDHGAGCQYVRFRIWPRSSKAGFTLLLLLFLLAFAAAMDKAWLVCMVFTACFFLICHRAVHQCGGAMSVCMEAARCNPGSDEFLMPPEGAER